MRPQFNVFIQVSHPVAEVFEAVVDPEKLSAYFTTGGARGWLEAGATVMWDFHDFPGAFPVDVVEVAQDERIALRWAANDPDAKDDDAYKTDVVFTFTPVDNGKRTKVEVGESGWPETANGVTASYSNCMGWSQMLCALKAWVEHGINLREGAYR